MSSIETASKGLAYIMRERRATTWEQGPRDGFTIFKSVPGSSKEKRCYLPKKNVDEAEQSLNAGLIPHRWVVDITCEGSQPKRKRASGRTRPKRRR